MYCRIPLVCNKIPSCCQLVLMPMGASRIYMVPMPMEMVQYGRNWETKRKCRKIGEIERVQREGLREFSWKCLSLLYLILNVAIVFFIQRNSSCIAVTDKGNWKLLKALKKSVVCRELREIYYRDTQYYNGHSATCYPAILTSGSAALCRYLGCN